MSRFPLGMKEKSYLCKKYPCLVLLPNKDIHGKETWFKFLSLGWEQGPADGRRSPSKEKKVAFKVILCFASSFIKQMLILFLSCQYIRKWSESSIPLRDFHALHISIRLKIFCNCQTSYIKYVLIIQLRVILAHWKLHSN